MQRCTTAEAMECSAQTRRTPLSCAFSPEPTSCILTSAQPIDPICFCCSAKVVIGRRNFSEPHRSNILLLLPKLRQAKEIAVSHVAQQGKRRLVERGQKGDGFVWVLQAPASTAIPEATGQGRQIAAAVLFYRWLPRRQRPQRFVS